MLKKKPVLLLFKISLSLGLILWITRGVDLGEVFTIIAKADLPLLALAFSLFFLGYVITAFRWRTLIRAQGGDAPILYLVRSFMVALFFNNFLPSTVGGDLVRMYDSWRLGNTKTGAVAVVLIDRFLGVTVLLCFALVAFKLSPDISGQIPKLGLWISSALIGAAIGCWLIFVTPVDRMESLSRRFHGLAGRTAQLFIKVLTAFQAYRGQQRAVAGAFALSVLLQLNVVFHFALVAWALDIRVPIEAMFLIVPVAVFIMMLPISINAIGVREAIFVFLFSIYGVADEQSLALAWVAYGFTLAQGVLGGAVFALRRESMPAHR